MITITKKFKFFLTLAKTNSLMARKFSSQGLGFGDIAVLFYISQAPEEKLRRVDLAQQMGLTASAVTRMLLPLEKIGIIKRQINTRDARVSYATLTPAGKRLLIESLESAEVVCDDLIPADKTKKLEEMSEMLNNLSI